MGAETKTTPKMKVVEWIDASISSGRLPPGAPFPSERALAEIVGVARNTAATAIDEAERRGVLMRRTANGRKRFVADESTMGVPALSAMTVVIMSDLNPFKDREAAPRWSDRFLSLDLLTRLTAAGKHVMVLNNDMLTGRDIDTLFVSRPGGIIITTTIGEHPFARKAVQLCKKRGIPMVVYGNHPDVQDCDRVFTDHKLGAKQITEWLIAQGCRRIIPFFPLPPEVSWEKRRLEGYAEAMREAGLKVLPCASHGVKDIPGIALDQEFKIARALATAKLLELKSKGGFDAIVCQTDHFAKIVISALRDLGCKPNRDVLVAGYDNIAPDTAYDPFEKESAIVTIDKHNEQTASDMAELLIARMSGALPDAPQCRTHPHELVVREQGKR